MHKVMVRQGEMPERKKSYVWKYFASEKDNNPLGSPNPILILYICSILEYI